MNEEQKNNLYSALNGIGTTAKLAEEAINMLIEAFAPFVFLLSLDVEYLQAKGFKKAILYLRILLSTEEYAIRKHFRAARLEWNEIFT